MTPYRMEQIGDCTLYLGDCLEILPTLGKFDAVVTDPPYGIGITRSNRIAVSRGMGGGTWDDQPANEETLTAVMAAGDQHIVWGGNYFSLGPARCVLVWDKINEGRDFADIEMAWTDLDAVARIFRMRPMNMDGGKQHPTQKPIDLMTWCVVKTAGQTVLDPFMGSGTTGVACVKTGKRFTGIEIDERYFEIACERIRQAYKQPDMFVPAPSKAIQEGLPL